MDMTERYLQRSTMLLRLLSGDLSYLVHSVAREEIARVLRLTEGPMSAPEKVSAFAEPVHELEPE